MPEGEQFAVRSFLVSRPIAVLRLYCSSIARRVPASANGILPCRANLPDRMVDVVGVEGCLGRAADVGVVLTFLAVIVIETSSLPVSVLSVLPE
jgi:hypothetical protein